MGNSVKTVRFLTSSSSINFANVKYKKYEIGTLDIIIREQEQELLEESEETGEDS